MTEPAPTQDTRGPGPRRAPSSPDDRGRPVGLRWWVLGGVLAVAVSLRLYELGRASFWYDEVVTIRLARTPNPKALLALLGKIDASRAPVHPLLLQGWVAIFGASEAAARLFSVACGVLTVAWVDRLGRTTLGDGRAGLWGAWLAALSPPLIAYSREARLYAWLVLLTCAAWDSLFSLRGPANPRRRAVYVATLVLLAYSHPLGVFMAAALGLASFVSRGAFGLSWREWLALHGVAALAFAPWASHYLDHAPEFTYGRVSPRFLLGTPIWFIGGNFLTLGGFSALILIGLFRTGRADDGRRPLGLDNPVGGVSLVIWLTAPPTLLYLDSLVSHPVFGPPRYTLFVAPAYLLLVARGLAKLPAWVASAVGLGAAVLSAGSWYAVVYAPDLKADWRSAAAALGRLDPSGVEPVVVIARGPTGKTEAARYYLDPRRPVRAMPDRIEKVGPLVGTTPGRVWFAVDVRGGVPFEPLPPILPGRLSPLDVDGLRLFPVDRTTLP